jgi:hypothetical protein
VPAGGTRTVDVLFVRGCRGETVGVLVYGSHLSST